MIRTLIVDHIRLTSDMFSAVLNGQSDIEVIGCCTTTQQAFEYLDRCDIALVSTNLPEDGAYRLVQAVSHSSSGVRVIMIGLSESNRAIVRYIEAGAQGFVSREDSVEQLLEHIRSVNRGEAILAPDLASEVVNRLFELASCFQAISPVAEGVACLTPREREVLQLIGRDYSNRDIADYLIIEVGTVKNHVHNILSKLNVSNRREAASYLPILNRKFAPGYYPEMHWAPLAPEQLAT